MRSRQALASSSVLDSIRELAAAGEIDALDSSFAELLARMSGEAEAETIALSGALVSHQRRHGHPCVALEAWAGRPLAEESRSGAALPALEAWQATLRASPLVGDGKTITPLVLERGRLYLYRYWKAERDVAERILARANARASAVDPTKLSELFRRLHPPDRGGAVDLQAVAAAAALHAPLTLVSGGPGTGKTTTITKILSLSLHANPELRIALAAPTGKAAARLSESIAQGATKYGLDPGVVTRISSSARTIHRLLGHHPGRARFRYDAEHPLPCELLVVDEASMVDLVMMDALLAALPASASLVLVGDKDQLASVEAGFVFGDICEAAGSRPGYSRAFAELYGALAGVSLPADGTSERLADRLIELKTSYRFEGRPGISRLSAAIRDGDAEETLAALDDPALDDVERIEHPKAADGIVDLVDRELEALLGSTSPDEALSGMERFRILCVTHRGPYGVDSVNRAFDRRAEARGAQAWGRWYHGRPVMVTANDYVAGLFNGDVGVCLADSDLTYAVWFRAADGSARKLPPARLPEHKTAWALTVHKSQGSEFDRVVVVLPEQDSALLTRELVYTAATRARASVVFVGPAASIATAVGRRADRTSGLAELLSQPRV